MDLLNSLLDLYARKVVGWSMQATLKTQLVLDAKFVYLPRIIQSQTVGPAVASSATRNRRNNNELLRKCDADLFTTFDHNYNTL